MLYPYTNTDNWISQQYEHNYSKPYHDSKCKVTNFISQCITINGKNKGYDYQQYQWRDRTVTSVNCDLSACSTQSLLTHSVAICSDTGSWLLIWCCGMVFHSSTKASFNCWVVWWWLSRPLIFLPRTSQRFCDYLCPPYPLQMMACSQNNSLQL